MFLLRLKVSNKWHVREVAIDTGDVDSDSKYIAIACNGVTRAKDDSAMQRSRRYFRVMLDEWPSQFDEQSHLSWTTVLAFGLASLVLLKNK